VASTEQAHDDMRKKRNDRGCGCGLIGEVKSAHLAPTPGRAGIWWQVGKGVSASKKKDHLLPTIVIMANLTRSAKSGSDWTLKDLDSYHISLNQVDPLLFFGLQVGKDVFSIALGKTLMTFHVIGVATTLGWSRAAE
jgi:hypothetical protein